MQLRTAAVKLETLKKIRENVYSRFPDGHFPGWDFSRKTVRE